MVELFIITAHHHRPCLPTLLSSSSSSSFFLLYDDYRHQYHHHHDRKESHKTAFFLLQYIPLLRITPLFIGLTRLLLTTLLQNFFLLVLFLLLASLRAPFVSIDAIFKILSHLLPSVRFQRLESWLSLLSILKNNSEESHASFMNFLSDGMRRWRMENRTRPKICETHVDLIVSGDLWPRRISIGPASVSWHEHISFVVLHLSLSYCLAIESLNPPNLLRDREARPRVSYESLFVFSFSTLVSHCSLAFDSCLCPQAISQTTEMMARSQSLEVKICET